MTAAPRCLVCESENTAPFLVARDHASGEMFNLRRCRACGLAIIFPRPADLGRYYHSFYRNYGPTVSMLFKIMHRLRVACWGRRLATGGRALEVGCGTGWMLDALRRRGWRVVGTERTVASACLAAEELQLPVVVGELDALRDGPTFDLIVLHHVLEHLTDPIATLRDCGRRLAPGGTLIIQVPNLDSWQFRFARENWFHLDVPRHLSHFTPGSLRVALERVGLRIHSISYVSLDQDVFGWLASILNRLGFPQNLLLHWMSGGGQPRALSPTGIAMLLASVLLLPLSLLVSMASWPMRAGAVMEVYASPSHS